MRTRAERRHQKFKRRVRARNIVKNWNLTDREVQDHYAEVWAQNCDNLCRCSGDCCCNPRRCGWSSGKDRKTRQEIRSQDSMNHDLQ